MRLGEGMGERDQEPAAIAGIPVTGRLAFTALRNGSKLGEHFVTFTRRNNDLIVDIAIDYAVKLGFITVFRYKLRGQETWTDGVLQTAQADTDANGKTEFMRAARDGAALIVEGSKVKRYETPQGTLIASHWNQTQLNGPMVNPQDGTLPQFSLTPRGAAKVKDSAGLTRSANRFALAGKNPMDLWYDTEGVWTSLQARVSDGSIISYMPRG